MTRDLQVYLEIMCETEEERSDAIAEYRAASKIINYERHTLTKVISKNLSIFLVANIVYLFLLFLQNSTVFTGVVYIYLINPLVLAIALYSMFNILDEIETWSKA